MDINDLITRIKKEFPNKAIDISESLELLKETINDTMDKINDELSQSYSNRNFEGVRHYAELGEKINLYEQKIEQIIELLEVDNSDNALDEEQQETIETETLPNYSAYLIDTNVEHTLYEDFTHKRPFAFRVSNQQKVEVKTWQELLIKTCELLIDVDEDKFISFEHKPTMNGKKRKYFSKQQIGMVNPKLVSDKIYIETNISGNGIRNLLLKLLKEYKYKASEYKVYLRADYTERHS